MTKKPVTVVYFIGAVAIFIMSLMSFDLRADSLNLTLRKSSRLVHDLQEVDWNPREVAIVVCDMWDSHHSVTAVRRVNEFAPRLNHVIEVARSLGITVVHSPSDCMPAYVNHPARKRALAVPVAANLPPDVSAWCHRIPSEERASYPIDQSDGGEDEDEFENAQWTARLKAEGRNPGTPWLRQTSVLGIEDSDYVASEGDVVWNILQQRKIKHVILSGVHTNMCVLGRPFGLRQMVRSGMDTVLLRDCTDVMYNPEKWPYVSHFTGLDLVIRHIEEHVCPTISSDQIVGGESFRFSHDKRPHLLVLSASDRIADWEDFARHFFDSEFRVSYVESDSGKGSLDFLHADCLLVDGSVGEPPSRRVTDLVRAHVASAKPVIGTGKACLEYGQSVFGVVGVADSDPPKDGHFQMNRKFKGHPLGVGFAEKTWFASLPSLDLRIEEGAQPLVWGNIGEKRTDRLIAWSYTRGDGGRSFATSLSFSEHRSRADFQRFLFNAVHWETGTVASANLPQNPDQRRSDEGWRRIGTHASKAKFHDVRTLLRTPSDLSTVDRTLHWKAVPKASIFINGTKLEETSSGNWSIPAKVLRAGDLNLLVARVSVNPDILKKFLPTISDGKDKVRLDSIHWQEKYSGNNEIENSFPIPPQFGAPTDLIQNWSKKD